LSTKQTVIVPSNPADRKTILAAIKEADNSLIRIDSERDQIDAIVDDLNEKFDLPKKQIKKLIATYHKQNFTEFELETSDFSKLYEAIIG
jgi:hypothetical protein